MESRTGRSPQLTIQTARLANARDHRLVLRHFWPACPEKGRRAFYSFPFAGPVCNTGHRRNTTRWLPSLNQPPLSNLVILIGRDHPIQNRRPQLRRRRAVRGIVDQIAFLVRIILQVV